MSPQLETVLEISAYGTTILFGALIGLIGLMYLLTSQRLFSWASRQPVKPVAAPQEQAKLEKERQYRAVALAVAVAVAKTHSRPLLQSAAASDWRRLHHTRRLNQPTARMRARS